jgi:hypothetical protein
MYLIGRGIETDQFEEAFGTSLRGELTHDPEQV